tara:strand:+ start:1381 stop:2031 length:651 start_codon:yes stop_codon:yes gene_type:complete
MQKLFENWRIYVEQQEAGKTLSGVHDKKRPYAAYVPSELDRSKPVNVVLYFHGKYAPGKFDYKKRLQKLIPHLPKKDNVILVVPFMGADPQRTPTLSQDFLGMLASSLASDYSFEIGELTLMGHSAGGKSMSKFLLSLSDSELAKVTVTYLDATYGYPATGAVVRRMRKLGLIKNVKFVTAGRGKTLRKVQRFKSSGAEIVSKPRLRHADLEVPVD